jgi:hypothetical protein
VSRLVNASKSFTLGYLRLFLILRLAAAYDGMEARKGPSSDARHSDVVGRRTV